MRAEWAGLGYSQMPNSPFRRASTRLMPALPTRLPCLDEAISLYLMLSEYRAPGMPCVG